MNTYIECTHENISWNEGEDTEGNTYLSYFCDDCGKDMGENWKESPEVKE